MAKHWDDQYLALLKSLKECSFKQEATIKMLKCCFLASAIATGELLRGLYKADFKNARKEIEFFKSIKPRFCSEIEYYRLLYHVDLFEPKLKKKNSG